MAKLTRRAALAALGALGAASVLGGGYVLGRIRESPRFRLTNGPGDGGGMMGVDATDMSRYMNMFNRHNELNRVVEEIPGGVRTTTESNSPDLAAQLQAHVSSMYSHVGQGAEVMCMSPTLPTLFARANGYRRRLTFTPTGVIAEETADDPALIQTIRAHAQEVSRSLQTHRRSAAPARPRHGPPAAVTGSASPNTTRRATHRAPKQKSPCR